MGSMDLGYSASDFKGDEVAASQLRSLAKAFALYRLDGVRPPKQSELASYLVEHPEFTYQNVYKPTAEHLALNGIQALYAVDGEELVALGGALIGVTYEQSELEDFARN